MNKILNETAAQYLARCQDVVINTPDKISETLFTTMLHEYSQKLLNEKCEKCEFRNIVEISCK